MKRAMDITRPHGHTTVDVGFADERGRVLCADSMSYFDSSVQAADVLVCGSFAGAAIAEQLGLCWGPRALIAHACGVGKNEAGISGLAFCQQRGVPMAAVETMSARISDGRSVYETGIIGHANDVARALGVAVSQPAHEAARLMLNAPPGHRLVSDVTDKKLYPLHEGDGGGIFAIWNPLLLAHEGPRPKDVFCIALHSGKVMAEWSSAIQPKGVIGNDGGFGKDRSGVAGLAALEQQDIAAAAVAAMSARIGDCLSTYHDGEISAANGIATDLGIRPGMPAHIAARLMLGNAKRS